MQSSNDENVDISMLKKRKISDSAKVTTGKVVKVQGLMLWDHTLQVPLDHTGSLSGEITVYARECVSTSKSNTASMPYLCFFQGGPGFEAPRPTEHQPWLREACKHFRVILLDQRGTGRSTPIRTSTLQAVGDVAAQVSYLRCFRADSIVQDAELFRKALVPTENQWHGRWSVLGQSFGGFCCVNYLSAAPEALLEAFLTGGIPPSISHECPTEIAYKSLYRRVICQNSKYYERFPEDVAVVNTLVDFLKNSPDGGVQTPNGTWIRPRTLQLLGLGCLGSGGGFEKLHYVLESALDTCGEETEVTPGFLKAFEGMIPFDTNPLYAVMHEACYTNGPPTNWSAHSVRELDYQTMLDPLNSNPLFFTGEMIFPWMFEDLAALRPLKEVAEAVAKAGDWSKLYNIDVLEKNVVPVAAASYCEDMYVDFNLAQDSANHIKGIRQWMTNEYMHSGIRDDGAKIFDRLLGMTRGGVVLF